MNGSGDLAAGSEHIDAVFVDVGLDGSALLAEVREKLLEARRIEDSARKQVRASLARLLEHRDRQGLAAPRALKLREPQRRRQSCRTAANDEDVDFEGFSVHPVPGTVKKLLFRSVAVNDFLTVPGTDHFCNSAVRAGRNSNRSPA